MKKPLVFFIVGPTASGKTSAAVFAAQRLNGEIVSADSIQIYKGLDVGSAKPSEEEKGGIKHHLIDFVDYTDENYNVACFKRDAERIIGEILSKGKNPIVAGGTGLYVNSLLYPLDFTAVEPNDDIRSRLLECENSSPGSLYERLSSVDPEAAARLHKNDLKRIVRALEVYETTGKSLTEQGGDFLNRRCEEIPFMPVIAGITMERSELYERINRRVDIMLDKGLLAEAKRLYEGAGKRRMLSLQAIGYKQLIAYFEGESTYDLAVELIKRDTRRFAKRQIAWFKRDNRIKWFEASAFRSQGSLNAAITDYFIEEMGSYERNDQA